MDRNVTKLDSDSYGFLRYLRVCMRSFFAENDLFVSEFNQYTYPRSHMKDWMSETKPGAFRKLE